MMETVLISVQANALNQWKTIEIGTKKAYKHHFFPFGSNTIPLYKFNFLKFVL